MIVVAVVVQIKFQTQSIRNISPDENGKNVVELKGLHVILPYELQVNNNENRDIVTTASIIGSEIILVLILLLIILS